MKTLARSIAIVSFSALTACTTVKVSTDYDRLTTFEKFKTYGWAVSPKTQTFADAKVDAAIKSEVDQQLATKGVKKTDTKRPDLFAIYHFTAAHYTGPKYYTDWGQPGSAGYAGWDVTTQTTSAIEKGKPGALVLDFVDAGRRRLVWRSVTPQVLAGAKGDDLQRAKGAVKAALAGFPPK
jgi:hypothetical protein